MTVGGWLMQAESQLEAAGIETDRLDTLVLCEHVTGQDRAWLLAHPENDLKLSVFNKLNTLSKRRAAREPLAYITGNKEFYGLTFNVTPAVLIPRPETEIMVEHAIENVSKSARVLEIGTGSGAVAVALKYHRPDLSVEATDISAAALKIARKNVLQHKVRLGLLEGDLFAPSNHAYHVILANLPYVPTGTRSEAELAHEPAQALYAGPDGLKYYRRFLVELDKHLLPDGWALIEASPTQRQKLADLAKQRAFKLIPMSEYIYRLVRNSERLQA